VLFRFPCFGYFFPTVSLFFYPGISFTSLSRILLLGSPGGVSISSLDTGGFWTFLWSPPEESRYQLPVTLSFMALESATIFALILQPASIF